MINRAVAVPFVVALLATSSPALAQSESGTFRLHKFAQAIGQETYTITRARGRLTLHTEFRFSDRGRDVPLTATLEAAADYTPRLFRINGSTSRFSKIDDEVTVAGPRARARDSSGTRDISVPERFFTIGGYAPVALEMALMRVPAGARFASTATDLTVRRSGNPRSRRGDGDGRWSAGRASPLQRERIDMGSRDALDGSRRQSRSAGDARYRIRPF